MPTDGCSWHVTWDDKDALKHRLLKNRVVMPSGCWERPSNRADYPAIRVGKRKAGLHQVALWVYKNQRCQGRALVPRHKCDNARCFNPDHLDIGTPQQNTQDSIARKRRWQNEPGAAWRAKAFPNTWDEIKDPNGRPPFLIDARHRRINREQGRDAWHGPHTTEGSH